MNRQEGAGLRTARKAWTMEDIHARCDEVGECLLWKFATDECGRPVAYMGGLHTSVRKFVYAQGGNVIRANYFPIPRCGDKRCLSHLVLTHRSVLNSNSRARSLMIPATRYAHQMRGNFAKLNPEIAAQIRLSEESEQVWAERLGVEQRAIKRIRAYETWKPAPVANSVFSLAASMGVA